MTRTHIIGIDQTLVDIEAKVTTDVIEKYGLSKGHSLVIDDATAEALYQQLKEECLITNEYAGGTIGNTLHNYSVLADDRSTLLGVMSQDIKIGSYGYRYLCNTSSRMDLNYLQGVEGAIGRCFALITEDGERTFAISEGQMNQLHPDNIPEKIFKSASALVLTAYLVRCKEGDPMPEATMRAIEYAKKHDVPVVLTLGTKFVIQDDPKFWQEFIRDNVSVVAMNEDEAEALTGESDPLAASDKTLDWADLVLCTSGPVGYLWLVTLKIARNVKLLCHYFLVLLLNLTVSNLVAQRRKIRARMQLKYIHISLHTWVAQKKLRTPMAQVMRHCLQFFTIWRQINTTKKMCLTQASTAMSI